MVACLGGEKEEMGAEGIPRPSTEKHPDLSRGGRKFKRGGKVH